ncbi:LysR substrate-binding domain-containing protein [Pseudomonas monsensis]
MPTPTSEPSCDGLAWKLPDTQGVLVDVPVTSRLLFDDLEVIADVAAEGMGLAWLPYWLIRDRIQQGTLIDIWGDRPRAAMECYVVWPAAQYQPLRSRLAIDVLVCKLEKIPQDG